MKAMQLQRIAALQAGVDPLVLVDAETPVPAAGELLLKVHACAVCHTELDEIEGRTAPATLPVIPGHQVVGTVVEHGPDVDSPPSGTRVGVGWIFDACGECEYCLQGRENLCDTFTATGRDVDGGYAEYMTVPAAFAIPIPDVFSDSEAAPLLCGGAIGLRSLRLAQIENGQVLGLTGFGGSNHQVLQLARHLYPDSPLLVWARNPQERELAMTLGAHWSGDTEATAPLVAQAIIDTTPVWKPVLAALKALAPGGRLVINAIRKESRDSELLADVDYPSQLWLEKEIKTVANVTRRDISDFLDLAARYRLAPRFERYRLEEANRALQELRAGKINGAKVLVMKASDV